MKNFEKLFIGAYVLSTFGLEGFVKVKPLAGDGGHLLKLKTVLLEDKYGVKKSFYVEKSQSSFPNLIFKFVNIDTLEDAKKLSGAKILLRREEAAPLDKNEYYIEDLKGINVVDSEGNVLGEITDVIEGGGGQLVEALMPNGELKLIPFKNEFFGEISIKNRTAKLLAAWILE